MRRMTIALTLLAIGFAAGQEKKAPPEPPVVPPREGKG